MLPLFKLRFYIIDDFCDDQNSYFSPNYINYYTTKVYRINNNYVGFLIHGINNIPNVSVYKKFYTIELYAHNNVFAFEYNLKTGQNKITLNISIFRYTQDQKEYLKRFFRFENPSKKSRICNITYEQTNNTIKEFTINYYNQWFTRLYKV